MFFLFGSDQNRRQDVGSYGPYVCACCGSYGRYHVYRQYSDISVFFLPIVMWNQVYYAETTCCGSLYELDPKKGRHLLYWDDGEITPQDLHLIRRGGGAYQSSGRGGDGGYGDGRYAGGYRTGGGRLRCSFCGYETDEDFDFCPHCGRRFT